MGIITLSILGMLTGAIFIKFGKDVILFSLDDSTKCSLSFFGKLLHIIVILGLICSIVSSIDANIHQLRDIQNVIKCEKKAKLYSTKAVELTGQFKTYLLDFYPTFEKDIYNKIEPGNLDVYLVHYPNLRTSDTVLSLVREISTLRGDYYDQLMEKEDVLAEMRYRLVNPWLISWMISDIPARQ